MNMQRSYLQRHYTVYSNTPAQAFRSRLKLQQKYHKPVEGDRKGEANSMQKIPTSQADRYSAGHNPTLACPISHFFTTTCNMVLQSISALPNCSVSFRLFDWNTIYTYLFFYARYMHRSSRLYPSHCLSNNGKVKGKVVPVFNSLCVMPWRRTVEGMHISTCSWPRN
jgi:hypothetical protein